MEIQVPDIERLADVLRARRDALARLDEPVGRTLDALRSLVQDAFDTEGAAVGASWPPLAPGTLRAKLRGGFPPQSLVRTGLLRDGWATDQDGNGGTLASLAPYAWVHQEGAGRVPQRRFLPDPDQSSAVLRAVFLDHVQNALDGET
jgi:phage gpG-like protein